MSANDQSTDLASGGSVRRLSRPAGDRRNRDASLIIKAVPTIARGTWIDSKRY